MKPGEPIYWFVQYCTEGITRYLHVDGIWRETLAQGNKFTGYFLSASAAEQKLTEWAHAG
jgi:hypothetical protein